MPWTILFVKKPNALPMLKGSEASYEHLDPADVLDEAHGPHAFSDRVRPHFVFVPTDLPEILEDAAGNKLTFDQRNECPAVQALLAPGVILDEKGNPLRKRANKLDASLFDAATRATFEDREALSVIADVKSAWTMVAVKADTGGIVEEIK